MWRSAGKSSGSKARMRFSKSTAAAFSGRSGQTRGTGGVLQMAPSSISGSEAAAAAISSVQNCPAHWRRMPSGPVPTIPLSCAMRSTRSL